MTTNAVRVDHDQENDVLYVKAGTVAYSASLADDDFVILNYDREGYAVGVQLIGASTMTLGVWSSRYRDVPDPVFSAVGGWLAMR